MAEDIVAVVNEDEALQVAVSEGTFTLSAGTNLAAPGTVESLSNVADVDVITNGVQTGSVLVYRTVTNKWTATTLLENQTMEAGEF